MCLSNHINRICHQVLGTPAYNVLVKLKRNGAAHVSLDFAFQKGVGVAQLPPISLYFHYLANHSQPLLTMITIPQVLGTPAEDVLAKFKRNGAAHVSFDFPPQKGVGIARSSSPSGLDSLPTIQHRCLP